MMATDEEMDAQFEQMILEALHNISTGKITIIKLNNRVIQVNIDEDYKSSGFVVKRQRPHFTLITDKESSGREK
ncbi:MAG TPA: hypothetical protein DDW65_01915 [Firmicutes bacterium]|nr:hypothetical protein [Bacillota bacterium]